MIAFKLTFKGDYDKVTFTANRFDASTVKTYEDENLFLPKDCLHEKFIHFPYLNNWLQLKKKLSFCA